MFLKSNFGLEYPLILNFGLFLKSNFGLEYPLILNFGRHP